MKRPIYRPSRFAYLLPVMWLQFQFDDPVIGIFFGATLAFVTAKLFPWIEYINEETKQ